MTAGALSRPAEEPSTGSSGVDAPSQTIEERGFAVGGRQPAVVPHAVLTVRDTGMGIDPSLLPHLFRAFVQGDRSLDRSQGGLGLGLALVKGLVELHGGEVSVQSDGLGHGAAFTVRLPLGDEGRPRGIDPRSAAVPHAARILIVEDNQDSAEMLRILLEEAGHAVDVAFSGPAGVEAAWRRQPDVVLCDVGLPGMDGYAVARALRQNPSTASLWLVALTGYGDPDHQRRSLDAGFDLHLTKPVELAALERLLADRFPA